MKPSERAKNGSAAGTLGQRIYDREKVGWEWFTVA